MQLIIIFLFEWPDTIKVWKAKQQKSNGFWSISNEEKIMIQNIYIFKLFFIIIFQILFLMFF